jgi:hypothetical protein
MRIRDSVRDSESAFRDKQTNKQTIMRDVTTPTTENVSLSVPQKCWISRVEILSEEESNQHHHGNHGVDHSS